MHQQIEAHKGYEFTVENFVKQLTLKQIYHTDPQILIPNGHIIIKRVKDKMEQETNMQISEKQQTSKLELQVL